MGKKDVTDEETPLKSDVSSDDEKKKKKKDKNDTTSVQMLDTAKAKALAGKDYVTSQYVAFKAKTRKSPWILSVIVIVACLPVIWNGFFGGLGELFTLDAAGVVLKIYQIFTAAVVLILEASTFIDPIGIQKLIGVWCKILETAFGRGMLQTLAGSLAMLGMSSLGVWVPGLILVVMGVSNMFWGLYTAWKLRSIVKSMKSLEKEKALQRGESIGDLSQVDLLMSKFKAIDVRGEGKLGEQDLLQACSELGIELSPKDAADAFSVLDSKKKGYIDLKDFEAWWLQSKGAGLFV